MYFIYLKKFLWKMSGILIQLSTGNYVMVILVISGNSHEKFTARYFTGNFVKCLVVATFNNMLHDLTGVLGIVSKFCF